MKQSEFESPSESVYYAIVRKDGRLQWGHKQSAGSPKLYMYEGQAKSLARYCGGKVVAVKVVNITGAPL